MTASIYWARFMASKEKKREERKGKKSSQSDEGGILIIAENRKARRDYEITEKVEAGLVLVGSEVKSIRDGGINLTDSYVREKAGELYLVRCHIRPYSHSRVDAHKEARDRKLLLHRTEIDKLNGQVTKKGLTLIPLKIYFRKGRCKLEIALGRGRKLHDKRENIKQREAEREMERGFRRNLKA